MSLGLSMYDSSSESDEEATNTPVKPTKREKVKIIVPKIKHTSSDEDEPETKRAKTFSERSSERSGLFSKLPAPRNSIGMGKQPNRPLIPHVFSKPKPEKQTPSKTVTNDQSDDSDLSDSETNFFSYVKKVEVPDELVEEPEEIANTINPTVNEILLEPPPPPPPEEPHSTQTVVAENFPPGPNQQWRQDEQFLRIQGKKNRKEKVEFIDVNADSALEGNKELLLKSISEEKNLNRMSHGKTKDGPSALSKRKHQMSYLIHQAQAREIELKNAWASGREARKAARMRYGF